MELNQDWRKLQNTFFSSSFLTKTSGATASGAIYCIHDNGSLVALFSEGEDLSEWVGASMSEVRGQYPNRVFFELPLRDVEQSLLNSLSEPHFEAQVAAWRRDARESVLPEGAATGMTGKSAKRVRAELDRYLVAHRHFLLDAVNESWWTRVLPSSFGVFLRFEGNSAAGRDFLLVYRKGKLEQFGVPDLSFMGADRRKDPAEVVKYLSDRCMVPVQGVLLRDEDWNKWSAEASPWREIAWAIQSNRVQLVPFRWSLVSIIAARGLLGF